ncbi:MAG TPA: glycosyltransferase [Chryseosolibacter sp.]|nr:glycosyltransferase [Chryseosolibacter sp.]
MKVLMFGWEFPPHISGGLGTACAGLTRALENEDVQVLFVVPKLRGGEKAQHSRFINASAVPIPQTNHLLSGPGFEPSSPQAPEREHSTKTYLVSTESDENVIEVPAFLDPYTVTSANAPSTGIRQWNYSFLPTSYEVAGDHLWTRPASTIRQDISAPESIKEPYDFSGGYGSNLMEEVARYADAAAEIARTNTFDIIHAHDWMTFRAGIAASQVSGKPLVIHVHATEIDRSGAPSHSVVYEVEKSGMDFAHKVVTVSNWTKQVAIQYYGVDPNKIEVVHNGITPKAETPVSYPAPPIGSRIVTFLGRVTHQKGPMYFVEAARKVHETFPDVHFVVAGAGDLLPDMIERIAQLRLSKNFHFTGFLKGAEIDRIWSMSNVYVMPSVSEPFGIAPLEAIQAGVPVILSNQTGVSEVMPHAIKVDFWNSQALAEAICDVLRFKSLANTLRRNGVEELKSITWDKAAKKLTHLYHDLISKHENKAEKHSSIFSGTPASKIEQASIL